MKWRRAARAGVALFVVGLSIGLAASPAQADPVLTLSCRDATTAELGSRSDGTVCSWTLPATTVAACTAGFDLAWSGPVLFGGSASTQTTTTTAMQYTFFHSPMAVTDDYRLNLSVRCLESSLSAGTTSSPFTVAYQVGACPTAATCVTRRPALDVGNFPSPVPTQVVAVANFPDPVPHPTSFSVDNFPTPSPEPSVRVVTVTGPVTVVAPSGYALPVQEVSPQAAASPDTYQTTVKCGGVESSASPSPSAEPSPSPSASSDPEQGCLVRVSDEQYLMAGLFASTFLVLTLVGFVTRHAVTLTK